MTHSFIVYLRRVLAIYQLDSAHLSSGRERLCPLCGHHVLRIHRTPLDRIVGFFIDFRRYRCQNYQCEWEGRVLLSVDKP